MYLMYVDESGDPGIVNSPTKYFILSAIIFHESCWSSILDDLTGFKKLLKSRYGLLMKEEIHASVFLSGKSTTKNNISRNDRLDLLKKCINWLSDRTDMGIISICVDKTKNSDPFTKGWQILIQEFENILLHKSFPGLFNKDKGFIIADNTNGQKLTKLVGQMRRGSSVSDKTQFNAGIRNTPLKAIIEDPSFRESSRSLILQMADVVAYFARQAYEPNNYMLSKGAATFYGRLGSVINRKIASDTFQIIEV